MASENLTNVIAAEPFARSVLWSRLGLDDFVVRYGRRQRPECRLIWPISGKLVRLRHHQLSNGKHEPIRCRASYDVLDEQNKLQLNINCASESYKFDLRGSATYAGSVITGSWSESTRNAAGTMSGKVEGAGFQVVAKGPTFTANLNLITRGDKQWVTIKSQDAQAEVQGATINLQRG